MAAQPERTEEMMLLPLFVGLIAVVCLGFWIIWTAQ